MKRRRIALDFSELDAFSMAQGQYRYAVDLVRGIARLESDLEFLLLGSLKEPVPELRAMFKDSGDRWRYRQLRPWNRRLSRYLGHARYAWLLRRERIDLLHVLHTYVPRFAPCPISITIYDLMQELFDDYSHARVSRDFRTYRQAVRQRARRAICISATTAADLDRLWGVDAERTDTVLLGTDFPELATAESMGTDGIEDPCEAPFTLVSPYNLEPRKNLHALLKAVALLQQDYQGLRLTLFGRAAVTVERERQFECTVRDLGLEGRVDRVGVLSDRDLARLYRRATLFVFPSLYEGFGLPVLEAMSLGACVVARNASAMREVVGDAGALVETSDAESLSAEVARLLDDKHARTALGLRARERAAHFNTERMARLTCQSYLAAMS